MHPKLIVLFFLLTLFGCQSQSDSPAADAVPDPADTLYFGGDILTMAGDEVEYAEALAVRNGKIVYVGDRAGASEYVDDSTTMQDLGGQVLLPGFIDSHSHLALTATKLSTVNLDPPPAGGIDSIGDIKAALSERLESDPPAEGEWLYGWGYDNAMLAEGRHPTKADLDVVSSEIPIAIFHFSTHMLVLNSAGLAKMGIDENSVAPEGGVIRRMPDSDEPNGILEETALLPIKLEMLEGLNGDALMPYLALAQEDYLSHGFTTISDMAGSPDTRADFMRFASSGELKIDLLQAMFFHVQSAEETLEQLSNDYESRFRVAGGKINLDGGTPGRTAFLREPYYTQEPDVDPDYRGYSSIEEQEDLNNIVEDFYRLEVPVFIHALGDAAIDQAIAAISNAKSKYPRDDTRTQLIHLQVLTEDQMETLQDLDVTMTFQNTHNFYFADFHHEYTLGPERTAKLCPLASAMNAGFSVTIHHDSPVHPVGQLDLIWIAVNRVGRSGTVYGPEERLTPYQALQASTINAAYQYFEEDRKGSLEVGKLADLVILDRNPLKVPAADIKDLSVVETIKEGEVVWTSD